MTASLVPSNALAAPARLPVPWRDPTTVSPDQLATYIETLELACAQQPENPDLRTCLGMAQAMKLDVYKSLDSLQTAVRLDPQHFWAQYKYSELLYRLRCLPSSEKETLRAVELAEDAWQLSLARKQLIEIRRLMREGSQKPAWTLPLMKPFLMTIALAIGSGVFALWL